MAKTSKSAKKAKLEAQAQAEQARLEEEERQRPALTRYNEDSDSEKEAMEESAEQNGAASRDKASQKKKWTNKQRLLVFGSRGLSYRDRHLMDDLRSMLPHSKTDSKMQRKDSMYAVNEVAEMKNCNKVLLFDGRKKRDLYLWAANVARGPSAKFQVENVHTMAELKMTGNCLRSSRPLLSFDKSFQTEPHLALIKELLTQIFSVPNHHPKSQPFFDHVFTFSFVDEKIWFRNYQILTEEDGSLAEIGPRFVLNPIKVFESSFAGQTLWENANYRTPTSNRSLLRDLKSGKYRDHVSSKAAYEAARPTESTYEVDPTDDVFKTIEAEDEDAVEYQRREVKPRKKTGVKKRGKEEEEEEVKESKEEADDDGEEEDMEHDGDNDDDDGDEGGDDSADEVVIDDDDEDDYEDVDDDDDE